MDDTCPVNLPPQAFAITGSGIAQPPNPWARISEVAAKLGVEPVTFGNPATVTAMGADGKAYDLWEVISKMIDLLKDSTAR